MSHDAVTQAALVAYYGEKPPALAALISACQEQISRTLGNVFQPYPLAQIHATVCGLEHVPGEPDYNFNFFQQRGVRRRMMFAGLLKFLRTTAVMPFTVQLGGFADHAYPFTSRGRPPFDRSFTQQGDKVVLMGWPTDPTQRGHAAYPATLDDLRRQLQRFNVLHKYHTGSGDVDNDFYFRIGLLDQSDVPAAELLAVAADVRLYLSVIQPLLLTIERQSLAVVAYGDERLPPESTQSWPLDHPDLTADRLTQMD